MPFSQILDIAAAIVVAAFIVGLVRVGFALLSDTSVREHGISYAMLIIGAALAFWLVFIHTGIIPLPEPKWPPK